jgi:hypothetical protein
VTIKAFINTAGGTVPPVSVYSRKKVLPAMFENGCPRFIGLAHESRWMNGTFFFSNPSNIFTAL